MKRTPKPVPLQPTHKFELPFRCWALDLLPTLPMTKDGFRHLLIMIDPFSKWVEIVPLKSKAASEVADAIRLHIISRFGVPLEIRTDRGLEF